MDGGRFSAPARSMLQRSMRTFMAKIGLSVCVALGLLPAFVDALPLETIEPRPFGYTVGDVVQRRLLVDRSRDGTLDPASLPRPGRYGRWFQLREVTPLPDGVRLAYQIVNAPPEPQTENLPSFRVRVIGTDGRARDADIGPYAVAMTPVVHFGSNEIVQADNIRPDLDPKPIDTSSRRQRVFLYAAALLALAVVQLAPALARWLGWRQAGPFVRAQRAMRRRLRHDDVGARIDALRCLHEALDEAAGGTLALDNVQRLLLAQPWLVPARANVEALLAESRAAFFGDAPPPTRARLDALASQLANLERRR
jgi:mxaA protein